MQDTNGSKIAFSLAIAILLLSLCTALAQVGSGERPAHGDPDGVMLVLARLPTLLSHSH